MIDVKTAVIFPIQVLIMPDPAYFPSSSQEITIYKTPEQQSRIFRNDQSKVIWCEKKNLTCLNDAAIH